MSHAGMNKVAMRKVGHIRHALPARNAMWRRRLEERERESHGVVGAPGSRTAAPTVQKVSL